METKNVRIPNELHRWLKVYAAQTNKGISEIVSELIESYKEIKEESNEQRD